MGYKDDLFVLMVIRVLNLKVQILDFVFCLMMSNHDVTSRRPESHFTHLGSTMC